MRAGLVAVIIAVIAGLLLEPVVAELDLEERDGAVKVDKPAYEAFTQENALQNLARLRGALDDFRNLAEQLRNDGERPDLNELKNADLETQNIGFPNFLSTVEGTLYRQQYEIRKAEYELAWKRLADGEIPLVTLQRVKAAFEQSERALHEFWNQYHIVD